MEYCGKAPLTGRHPDLLVNIIHMDYLSHSLSFTSATATLRLNFIRLLLVAEHAFL